jgi:methylglutaconyl-CoA hydratase
LAYQHLISERDGAVERLTLNRADVRNAFNDVVIDELTNWALAIAADERVRAVVVSGAGPTFCAGADITWMAKTVGYSEAENVADATRASRMFAAIDQLTVPVVARVHGAAIGGGAGLVAVCDVVVAEAHATFGFTEVKLGIIPAVISPFVIAKIGRSAARELFLTGRRFTAQHAQEIGLVHTVVPPENLDAAVAGVLREVLAGGREAIAAAKTLIADVSAAAAGEVSTITASALAKRRVSPEGQEGLRAFLEKRKPDWSGA